VKLVFKKFTVEKSEKDRYFLIVEDTNTDEVFNIEVARELWDNYIEGDELKILNDPMWQKPLGSIPYPITSNPSYPDITTAKEKIDWQKDYPYPITTDP
jgi:hypothetical protein